MVDSQVTSITPATHADRHSVGGADPLVNPLLRIGSDGAVKTSVFNAAVANVWTDLDLSAVVGSARRTVLLYLLQAAAPIATDNIRVRQKGETANQLTGCEGSASQIQTQQSHGGYIITATDDSGIIQIRSAVSKTFQIWVVSWW